MLYDFACEMWDEEDVEDYFLKLYGYESECI